MAMYQWTLAKGALIPQSLDYDPSIVDVLNRLENDGWEIESLIPMLQRPGEFAYVSALAKRIRRVAPLRSEAGNSDGAARE